MPLANTNTVLAFARSSDVAGGGKSVAVVVLNCAGTSADIALPLGAKLGLPDGATLSEALMLPAAAVVVAGGSVTLTVPAHTARVLLLQ